ncbi:MAG: ATP-binding protein [Eubacteriales bacterium]|jgi:MinD superfamily P-loop ATPase|nr:ATP-binding protein [Bacillota bacterium]MBV1728209.1 ATP-binding protein [Desulforudis sp.]MDP3051455.1 ATP-binding protein [Eubacteriales bacterium]MDQ7789933.1 ATP-binding protein [Clostridia bacterium]MBU4532359.1 ATP-binding protein [Bacillota bacterium]
MMVAVASGKGGTGKTTLSAALADALGDEVILLDCDVEEPNAALLMHPEWLDRYPVHTPVPTFRADDCTQCGECVSVCAYNALAKIGDDILVFNQLCHGCGACLYFCTPRALTEDYRQIGSVQCGHSGNVRVVEGRLNLGEVLAPVVIKAVKRECKDASRVIVDSPPGTSCPVIAALDGVDFCVIVAEDSAFGLHDMQALVEVLRVLQIPFGVVVNRAGLGDDRVLRFCEREGIRVLESIPFDRQIARLTGRGYLFTAEMPEWRPKMRRIWSEIEGVLSGARNSSA